MWARRLGRVVGARRSLGPRNACVAATRTITLYKHTACAMPLACLLTRPLDLPARAPLPCAGLGTEKSREDDGPRRGARAARARLSSEGEIGEGRGREEGRTKEGQERGERRGKGQKGGGRAEEEGADGSDEVVDASHLKPLKRLLYLLKLPFFLFFSFLFFSFLTYLTYLTYLTHLT